MERSEKLDINTPLAYNEKYRFTWDSIKNQRNIKKHFLSFEEASEVFSIPEHLILEEYDFNHSIDEDRIITIGPISRGVIVVISVEREDVIRIISARFATTTEKKRYHEMIERMSND